MARKLTPEEREARAAERAEQQKAARQKYIEDMVSTWPPLSEAQINLIAILLRPESERPDVPRQPSAYELEQRRLAQEREEALKKAKKAALAMTACDVCDLQPDQHQYAQRSRIDFHEWMPGRAEKLLKRQASK